MSAPTVKIKPFHYSENTFTAYGKEWTVFSLIEHSKGFPEFDLPLAAVDISYMPWGDNIDIQTFLYHANRINNADLKHPILLAESGYICDGWHRLCKAILEGRTHIKAIRLETMPADFTTIEK